MPPNPPESSIDGYLARLAAQLKSLPATAREDQLRELRQHLDALVAAHTELGMTEYEAVQVALHQFGKATEVGGKLRHEWQRKSSPHSVWPAFRCSMKYFGGLTAFYMVLFVADGCYLRFLPSETISFGCWEAFIVANLLVLPGAVLMAGWKTGKAGLDYTGRGIAGTIGLISVALLTSRLWMLRPGSSNTVNYIHSEIVMLGFCQLLFWMPVGIASGLLANRIARRKGEKSLC